MRPLLALLRCSHPAPTVAVTAFAAALALGTGKGRGALVVAAAVLAGQLSVGWSNDWLDRHRDRVVGRRDKPLVTGTVAETTVAAAAGVALAASLVLSLAAAGAAGFLHVAAVLAAWSYNLGLKRTPLSPLPYAVAFGLLPAFVTLSRPGPSPPPPWLVVAAALLGAGAHFTNTLGDVDDDARTGVRGLPQRFGPRLSSLVAASLLACGLVVTALGPSRPLRAPTAVAAAVGLGLVGGVVWAGLTRRGHLAFTLTLAAAGAAVIALLTAGR